MWIRKWERDRARGVDSPVPTQIVSNEEFIPRPQTDQQKKVEALVGELSTRHARKLGMERRDFLRSAMGMATAFWASNQVYGVHWDVREEEMQDAAAVAERWPKGEYFIVDVQTHFTNGFPLQFRTAEFVRNMGFDLKNDAASYGLRTFVKEIFFDSETDMAVISGVPGRETIRDKDGQKPEGKARGGGILPSWLMADARTQINALAGGTTRALCQGNCSPNHYWDRAANAPDRAALFEQMEQEVTAYKINSWKWYCHTDPGRSGDGFRLDDEKMTYPFYEQSRKLGLKIFSVHKGFASQSRQFGHFAHPGDVEKAALAFPDLTFVVYHSALKHGPGEPEFSKDGFFDPATGDFAWHAELMKIKERNPKIDNVYCEIGSSFGLLAVAHPQMCQHLIGRNVKTYGADRVVWGTDCLWWGSPQWVIDAFKRFQISDELCEKFGYRKLTKEDKAKIFGLNAARIYGIDLKARHEALPKDAIERLKTAYRERGGRPENAAYGWVRDDG